MNKKILILSSVLMLLSVNASAALFSLKNKKVHEKQHQQTNKQQKQHRSTKKALPARAEHNSSIDRAHKRTTDCAVTRQNCVNNANAKVQTLKK